MASNARIFFAGVGTTFLILGVGFGGGLILASSTLKQPAAYQARATAEPPSPIRVILPASADAAQPPQLPQQSAAESAPEPAKEVQPTMRIEGTDTKKVEDVRERRKRYADRKAKREAAKRQPQRIGAPVMAYGGYNNPGSVF
jgi:hypothetical protein